MKVIFLEWTARMKVKVIFKGRKDENESDCLKTERMKVKVSV